MAKVRSLLKDASVLNSPGKRMCHRNRKHAINKGELLLEVRDPATGGYKNYCKECAQPILQRVYDDLHAIESQLLSN